MYVGVCRLDFHIPGSRSLKDKRRLVRSVSERIRNKFGASVAEVAEQDKWQIGVLGVSVVSGNLNKAHEMLDSIIRFAAEFAVEAEVVVSGMEVFNYED